MVADVWRMSAQGRERGRKEDGIQTKAPACGVGKNEELRATGQN